MHSYASVNFKMRADFLAAAADTVKQHKSATDYPNNVSSSRFKPA